jgi:mannose-1-phosphate guanylyltransferase
VTDVILACSYRVDDVRAALGDGAAYGVRLRYVVEREPLGTGGGLRNATDLAVGTVVVFNGDVITDADLTAMGRFHRERGSRTTIYLRPVEDPRPFGLVETDADGRVRAFREKPTTGEEITTNTINAGTYLIDAPLLERIPRGKVLSIEREFFPVIVADGVPTYGWIVDPYWRDIGSPVAYRAVQTDLLEQRVSGAPAPEGRAVGGSWIADDARIDPGASVEAPSVVGPGTVIAARARVGPRSVLGARCRIGAGARLDSAILWDDVEIGAGAVLRDCVVASGSRIGPGVEIAPETTLAAGTVMLN